MPRGFNGCFDRYQRGLSITSDLASCDKVEELGLQRWRRVVVADFNLCGTITELLKCRFYRVIAEYLAYSERVLGQYGNDLLERDDFDVLLDTTVFTAGKMASTPLLVARR